MINVRSPLHRPHDLPVLIDAGDLACSIRDRDKLIEVAHALSLEVTSPLQAELVAVESLAGSDFDEATRHWSTVARCVRDWAAASLVHRC